AFDVIRLLDKNLKPVSILDIGTEAARPHLLYGWSFNETWAPGQTIVWASGAERKATLEIEIPEDAVFLEISCISFPEQNSITMKINHGEPLVFPVPKRMTTFLFRLGNSDDDTTKNNYENDKMPIAMFLDSREAAAYFDGFATYGSFLGSNRVIVSDPSPTILTVGCGYDDRKIRYPGAFTDREDGMLYRRQWEKALEGRPDIILINTWNEWGEGTIIEPTVEFGYKYLEITLTYSLIFQGKMSTSAKPINTGLTIYKYHGTDQGDWDISFSSEKQNKISFYNLSLPEEANINCQVFKDDQPYKDFTLNSKDKILQIDTQNSKSIYKIQIRKVVSSCIKGDLDRDGKITSKDVIILLQIATGLIKPTTYQECSADANNDGKISANDAIITLRRSVGLLAPGNRPYNMYSTISIDEFYGQIGDEIIVPLNIDNAKNFAGGDICITYDNKVLAPLDIIPDTGILLAGNTSELGIIRISYVNPENLDSKILAKIKFRVISDNTSPLMLSEASLYQNDNQPSVMKKINGKFTPLILRPICNELLQNFPNPFNPETWIPYSINEDSEVTIKIYEATGKLVRRLDLGFKPAGSYKTKDKAVYWDGSNDNGEKVASGVYFYNIETANFSITRKMIILK
ncbi:T9SS type A sorting domain-containing protein, partial [Candidatus Poribacteria bacterium]|nr:T9SS type A sorting domain-containing protein [Candidatus Poribacteria bacterium]